MLQHDDEQRYSRHLSLAGFGREGLARLQAGRVLVVGVGGLGCPLSLYLAASGVGTLALVDGDRVALSNLNRQILFETADIGRLKVEAAADRLEELNPEICLEKHPFRLEESNAEKLISHCDIVADGSDNPQTRDLVNRLCHALQKPLVSAAIHGWQGQLYRFHTAAGSACYRCLYPDLPREDETPKCSESGVFSPLAGMMGSWQAGEVIRHLLGHGAAGTLHRINLQTGAMKQNHLPRDAHCPICSG